MLREGSGKFEAFIPGNPGKSRELYKKKTRLNSIFDETPVAALKKARLNSRFDLFSCLDQPSTKLQIMIVFPVLIPGQNFLFPGTGREKTKCHGKGNLRLEFPGITENGNSRSPGESPLRGGAMRASLNLTPPSLSA